MTTFVDDQGRFRLTNAQAMHRQYPHSFEVPSISTMMQQLRRGDFVKLRFEPLVSVQKQHQRPSRSGERFWVRVTHVPSKRGHDETKMYQGVIDNDLQIYKVPAGTSIRFHPDSILNHVSAQVMARAHKLDALFDPETIEIYLSEGTGPFFERVASQFRDPQFVQHLRLQTGHTVESALSTLDSIFASKRRPLSIPYPRHRTEQ